jgi:hypothetical protein
MSDTGDFGAAFQALVRMLEDAVRAGVTALGLEYEGRDLIVYYEAGSVGVGAPRIPEDLQEAVINEIIKRAGLARKSRGKMPITLLGKDYEVAVQEYDSFGESAFNLTLKERKRKAGG